MRHSILLLAASGGVAGADWVKWPTGEDPFSIPFVPRETGTSSTDTDGWTPKPTEAAGSPPGPKAVLDLLKRGDEGRLRRQEQNTWINDKTCGWFSSLSSAHFTCSESSSCATNDANVVACVSGTYRPFFTACVDYEGSDGGGCSNIGSETACCQTSSVGSCGTFLWPGNPARSMYRCFAQPTVVFMLDQPLVSVDTSTISYFPTSTTPANSISNPPTTSTSTPPGGSPPSNNNNNNNPTPKPPTNTGAIVGGAVAGGAVLLILLIAFLLLLRRKRRYRPDRTKHLLSVAGVGLEHTPQPSSPLPPPSPDSPQSPQMRQELPGSSTFPTEMQGTLPPDRRHSLYGPGSPPPKPPPSARRSRAGGGAEHRNPHQHLVMPELDSGGLPVGPYGHIAEMAGNSRRVSRRSDSMDSWGVDSETLWTRERGDRDRGV